MNCPMLQYPIQLMLLNLQQLNTNQCLLLNLKNCMEHQHHHNQCKLNCCNTYHHHHLLLHNHILHMLHHLNRPHYTKPNNVLVVILLNHHLLHCLLQRRQRKDHSIQYQMMDCKFQQMVQYHFLMLMFQLLPL